MERTDATPDRRPNTGREVKQEASAAKDDLKRQAKGKAEEMKAKARNKAEHSADKAKHEAASKLNAYAAAARAAARALSEHDEGTAGRQGEAAAEQIERFARHLEEKDTRSLLREVKTFARRNPEWFLGGSVLVGLAAGRFLRASSHDEEDERYRYDSTYSSPNLPARVPEDTPATAGTTGYTATSGNEGLRASTSGSGAAPSGAGQTVGMSSTAGTGTTPGRDRDTNQGNTPLRTDEKGGRR